MYDFNNYLSGEIRHLAFQKSDRQATWQDSVKQKRALDIQARLGKYIHVNFLAHWIKALVSQTSQARRAQQPSTSLITNLPSHHKAG